MQSRLVVELKGGLGNQMFQYASAYGIARSTNQKFFIYTGWYDDNKNAAVERHYELDCFKISAQSIQKKDLNIASDNSSNRSLFKKPLRRYVEPAFTYDDLVLNQKNVYLDGYWQSPRYFDAFRSDILNEFTFQNKPSAELEGIAQQIKADKNSISLHVRRGDYVSVKSANTTHGTTDLEYYKEAVATLAKTVSDPHFFIFSDDPEWCAQNLKPDAPHTFVTGSKTGSEDLQLMTLCKHNILANSTFSWWGAWLNNNETKTVIAPKKWFRDETLDTRDLFPKDWILL